VFVGWHWLPGHCQQSVAESGLLVVQVLKPCTVRVVEGFGISISKVDRGRSCKDDLRGSLDDQQPLTVALRHHGHRPALKIEWNFV